MPPWRVDSSRGRIPTAVLALCGLAAVGLVWFAHQPERFDEFRRRYTDELREHADELAELGRRARGGKVTLVYAARDTQHSNAAVLAAVIRGGFPRKA
jgi:uncharacterized protein YeaO (DUF488 family)